MGLSTGRGWDYSPISSVSGRGHLVSTPSNSRVPFSYIYGLCKAEEELE